MDWQYIYVFATVQITRVFLCERIFSYVCVPLKSKKIFIDAFAAYSDQRHSGVSVCLFVRDCILKVNEHDILQTTCRIFTKFTTSVQLGRKIY